MTLYRPATTKFARISRADFLHEYKLTVARQLKVFASRENVAMSREALRNVLVDGKVMLKPDVPNARFESVLSVSHEELLKDNQIDIKMVAGACFVLIVRRSSTSPISIAARSGGEISQASVAGDTRRRRTIYDSTEASSDGAACNAGANAPRHFAVDMAALRENFHDREGRAGWRR